MSRRHHSRKRSCFYWLLAGVRNFSLSTSRLLQHTIRGNRLYQSGFAHFSGIGRRLSHNKHSVRSSAGAKMGRRRQL